MLMLLQFIRCHIGKNNEKLLNLIVEVHWVFEMGTVS